MADNGLQLMVVDGASGYILTLATNALQTITDPDFPATTRVAFLDGYFVFFFPGTGRFGITALLDGFTIDPLDFATAEGSPDNIVSILADHRELWIAGTRSIEVWFNSGDVDFPFDRIQGAFIEYGCGAAESLVNLDNTVYWLGSEERGQHIVWRADGYQPIRVSTHAVEFAIASYSEISRANARAYAHWQEGHAYYVLTFDEATWVYDVASRLWHERASLTNEGLLTRHRVATHTVGLGENLVGDIEDGRIYALDLDTFTEDGREIIRLRRCPHFAGEELQRLFHHWFQLDLETGVGLDGSPPIGADPRLVLRFSDDGGHTWSNEKEARIGKLGEFKFRAFWNRLGTSRDRVYEIRQSDPVKTAWINAKVQASSGKH
ncbi:MAG: packaged DNA stabilization protein [Gammaproteobacteria bacterium]